MTVTPTSLTRAAGISAAVAGLLFIAVQIKHPPMDVSSVTTTEWVVRQTAKTVMAAAALVGITGMYLRQVRQMGILGLVGYLVFGAGYVVMMGIEFTGLDLLTQQRLQQLLEKMDPTFASVSKPQSHSGV